MATSTQTSSSGIGPGTLLTVLFIGLKLTGNIDWSWWWVLSPLWIPLGIFLFFLFITLIVFIISEVKK